MTAAEKEAYVRDRWEKVRTFRELVDIYLTDKPQSWRTDLRTFDDWQAAYDFTLQREKEKAEVEEEIVWLKGVMILTTPNEGSTIGMRTLKRLQAIKAELGKGMVKG